MLCMFLSDLQRELSHIVTGSVVKTDATFVHVYGAFYKQCAGHGITGLPSAPYLQEIYG